MMKILPVLANIFSVLGGLVGVIVFIWGKPSLDELLKKPDLSSNETISDTSNISPRDGLYAPQESNPSSSIASDDYGKQFSMNDKDTKEVQSPVVTTTKDTEKPTHLRPTKNSKPYKSHSNFFITFIKTPLVYIVISFTLAFCLFAIVVDAITNLFCNFEHGFALTSDLWAWGWKQVTVDWYWNNGVGWHLSLSIFIWLLIHNVWTLYRRKN